jgi:hypothetical protein
MAVPSSAGFIVKTPKIIDLHHQRQSTTTTYVSGSSGTAEDHHSDLVLNVHGQRGFANDSTVIVERNFRTAVGHHH